MSSAHTSADPAVEAPSPEHGLRDFSAAPSTEGPVSGERLLADLQDLAGFVAPDLPGWSRQAFTEFDVAGRHRAKAFMESAGLTTRIDGAGNVIGVLPGDGTAGGRQIMLGSHTDTVEGGGRFDGIVGVLGAIEVVRALRESGTRLHHDLVVVVFFNEEVNRFGMICTGSHAFAGVLTPEAFDLRDEHGMRMGDALAPQAGIDPEAMLAARYDLSKVTAFLELHIEQGPNLENSGVQLGVVETITGISRFTALFEGRQDHAGTTPMDVRADACTAAAGTILAVERIAGERPTSRGTCGMLTFTPTAVNVVTETARVQGEFRSDSGTWLREAEEALTAAAGTEASTRGVTLDIDWLETSDPQPMAGSVMDTITAVADDRGISRARMFSGAGHDSQILAPFVDTGMIFVPSVDGRSHCPEEFTDTTDIVRGVEVLLETVLRIDAA
ncbi:M20 family metallo-hydrolase [Brevibacterium litoralis]|uniref:M20 family metallo-hydrolase n=1 Tax=Brevibacterium litoralis TaxID=3138935 RepID=UPI0032EB69BE